MTERRKTFRPTPILEPPLDDATARLEHVSQRIRSVTEPCKLSSPTLSFVVRVAQPEPIKKLGFLGLKEIASTRGWGFAQFTNGKPDDEALHKTCFVCHASAKDSDFVFTRYSP
jgi:hypothetical protein